MNTDPEPTSNFRGRVDVAEGAIADLVRDVVRSCYGVVGIGTSSRRRLVSRVPRPWRRSAIDISVLDGRVSISVPVIIEYGTPVATVARNVIQSVSFQIQQTLGLPVERVDVHVAGLRHTTQSDPVRS
jgi:uncharacterized alkaline shock family protein YloU